MNKPPKMSVFERLIRAHQGKGRGPRHRFPTMTSTEVARAILSINDRETAVAFKVDYIEFTREHWRNNYDPYQIVNENIAACFQEMSPDQVIIWTELGVKTPVQRFQPARY